MVDWGVNRFADQWIWPKKIMQTTDFILKFNGFADPVNIADHGFKQDI